MTDALDLHAASGAAYTSNTLVRTFPDGLDVEVVAGAALRQAGDRGGRPGRARARHPVRVPPARPRFGLRALRTADHLGDERWTIDTAEDLADLRGVVDGLASPVVASWRQILAVAGARRGPSATELWLRPLERSDEDALDHAGHRPPAELAARADDPRAAQLDRRGGRRPGRVADRRRGRRGGTSPLLGAPRPRPRARRLLDRQLAADRQVVSLVEDV